MPLATVTLGANLGQVFVVSDPSAASQQMNVIAASGDAKSIAGQYAALIAQIQLLQNAAGTFDLKRAAVGTTGIDAVNSEGTKATYSCGAIADAAYATPTDLVTLVGSATKTVRVLRVSVSGAATAGIIEDIQLIKRTTANTAGTASQPAIAAHDSNDAAASAVVNQYSVIPSGLGAGVNVRVGKLNMGELGAAGVPSAPPLIWDFTTRNGKGLVLRGIAQCLALNWNGAAWPSGGVIDYDIEWTEE
jgi:hypothetical protein